MVPKLVSLLTLFLFLGFDAVFPVSGQSNRVDRIDSWCRQVLSKMCSDLPETSLETQHSQMHQAWHANLSMAALEYDQHKAQCAYVWYNLGRNAPFWSDLMTSNSALSAIFRNNSLVSIVNVGSGPGTEMTGILHYLSTTSRGPEVKGQGQPLMVRFLLADIVPGWENVNNHVESVIRSDISNTTEVKGQGQGQDLASDLLFEKLFYQWDITKRETLGLLSLLPTVRSAHIVTFSLMFSEILEDKVALATALDNVRTILDVTPPGVVLVFRDMECRPRETPVDSKTELETQLDKVFQDQQFEKIPGPEVYVTKTHAPDEPIYCIIFTVLYRKK